MVVMTYEPYHCFEYEKTAYEFMYEVGGDYVDECYVTSKVLCPWGSSESDCEFVGFVVIRNGKVVE